MGTPGVLARFARRGGLVTWALLGLLVCWAAIRFAQPVVAGYDWEVHKPSSWLIATARGGDAEGAASALEELVERVQSG